MKNTDLTMAVRRALVKQQIQHVRDTKAKTILAGPPAPKPRHWWQRVWAWMTEKLP